MPHVEPAGAAAGHLLVAEGGGCHGSGPGLVPLPPLLPLPGRRLPRGHLLVLLPPSVLLLLSCAAQGSGSVPSSSPRTLPTLGPPALPPGVQPGAYLPLDPPRSGRELRHQVRRDDEGGGRSRGGGAAYELDIAVGLEAGVGPSFPRRRRRRPQPRPRPRLRLPELSPCRRRARPVGPEDQDPELGH